MIRRTLVLGMAAGVLPHAALAQMQAAPRPLVGFVSSASLGPFAHLSVIE